MSQNRHFHAEKQIILPISSPHHLSLKNITRRVKEFGMRGF